MGKNRKQAVRHTQEERVAILEKKTEDAKNVLIFREISAILKDKNVKIPQRVENLRAYFAPKPIPAVVPTETEKKEN